MTNSPEPEKGDSQTGPRKDLLPGVAFVLAFAGVLGFGLVTRGMLIDMHAIHFDEAMHFVAAKQPNLPAVVAESRVHTHPPLAFVMFHAFRWTGDSETAARLPSLLFFVTSCIAGFAWLRSRFGSWPALFGVAVLCGSLPYAKLSCEMRGYTFLLTIVFGGLILRDRFLKSGSLPALAGSTLLLLAALFTHYSVALLLLVLGVTTLVHFGSRTSSRPAVVAWCLSQGVLLAGCGVLYSHVRHFQSSETAGPSLWNDWLQDSAFDPESTAPPLLTLGHGLEFLAFLVGGPAWILLIVLASVGVVHTIRRTERDGHSRWIAVAEALLIALPWIVALSAFHARVYPIGRTRHSMWLLPFLLAGVASGLAASMERWPRATVLAATLLVGTWFTFYTLPPLRQTPPEFDRPTALHELAEAIREHVPEGERLITDVSTRYQLEFYLAGPEVTHGETLAGDFTEYAMDGRRVLVAPVFYAAQFDSNTHSDDLAKHIDRSGTWMLWANRGFETDHPRFVLAQCGIRKAVEVRRAGASWLVKALPPVNTPVSSE